MPFDEYFDRRSGRFSSFYRSRTMARALGRDALFARLDFAVAKAVELGATSVLDVGCGSGPLFEPLAHHTIRVVGIEPAPSMVTRAEEAASHCNGRAEVVTMGWEDLDGWTGGHFDVAVALGVFDYVADADALIAAMAGRADHVIASFPAPGLRTELRKLRYGARGVAVHGRSRADVDALVKRNDLHLADLAPLGRAGHILVASHQTAAARAERSST